MFDFFRHLNTMIINIELLKSRERERETQKSLLLQISLINVAGKIKKETICFVVIG